MNQIEITTNKPLNRIILMAASTYKNTRKGISACIGTIEAISPSAPTQRFLASANETAQQGRVRTEQKLHILHESFLWFYLPKCLPNPPSVLGPSAGQSSQASGCWYGLFSKNKTNQNKPPSSQHKKSVKPKVSFIVNIILAIPTSLSFSPENTTYCISGTLTPI